MITNMKEYQRQWEKDHREHRNKYQKKYLKEYRKEHPRYRKKYMREYHIDNREERLKIQREYYKNHFEEIKECKNRYNKTEEGKANRQRGDSKRRARERYIINTLTSKEWLDILEDNNYRCFYCGVEFDCENLPTKDHVIPVSKGGHNIKENIVPACRSCNSKKHNKSTFPTHRLKWGNIVYLDVKKGVLVLCQMKMEITPPKSGMD